MCVCLVWRGVVLKIVLFCGSAFGGRRISEEMKECAKKGYQSIISCFHKSVVVVVVVVVARRRRLFGLGGGTTTTAAGSTSLLWELVLGEKDAVGIGVAGGASAASRRGLWFDGCCRSGYRTRGVKVSLVVHAQSPPSKQQNGARSSGWR